MIDNFAHIRPYSEVETLVAVKKLFNDPHFLQQLSVFEDKINIDEWVKKVLSCKTQLEFHLAFADRVFHYIMDKSCRNTFFSGIENTNAQNQYLFIGNHRDIILDSSFLQVYLFQNGNCATRTAIGDNLLANSLFTEIAKIHKMFLVLRSGSLKERMANTHTLASYIHHSLFEDKESVWIAQGNGRTKNGDDKTQQGLLKMFTFADPQNAMPLLKRMNITPVAISYQYEPCAKLKARELALSEDQPYKKQPGEDTNSILEGITGYKGDVHFVIGKPLQQEFDEIPEDISLNDKLTMVCDIIDNQIYENYFLYPQNYIAIDIRENTNKFSDRYTQEEKSAFLEYLNKESTVPDVSKEKMMRYLLDIYANPVRNKKTIFADKKNEK